MAQFTVLTSVLVLFPLLNADARGKRLLEVEGVELHGETQVVRPGGGTCHVLETDTGYEAKKENHGAPMDIWLLEFSVRNNSERWLDHLIATFQIESEWPACMNWDIPNEMDIAREYPYVSVDWSNTNGHIQESGRNIVAPGEKKTETRLLVVLRRDQEQQF